MTNLNPVGWLTQKQWDGMAPKERALQLAAWLCDRVKVRGQGKPNHGPMVREILKAVGLDEGYPWCAAFVAYCLKRAGYRHLPPNSLGAVRSWSSWAVLLGRRTKTPVRGDLFYWLNANGTGHIGFVVKPLGPLLYTIEGNTNEQGSREGDGVYRKVRLMKGKRFIRL